jgi:hypothetical protein
MSLLDIALLLIVFSVLKRIYYELTTGAARRAIIKQHGCQPVYRYKHRGFFGKLLGVDVILDSMEDDKKGRAFDAARERFFRDRNTVQVNSLGKQGQ